MDNPRFRKVLVACNLLPDELAINEIDIIYTASKARYKQSSATNGLSYEAFVHALLLISQSMHD